MAKKYIWCLLVVVFFGSCHVGRYVIYNFANINDYKKFQNREILNSGPAFQFHQKATHNEFNKALMSSNFTNEIIFDSILDHSKTVAFLVIRNDSLLYEWYAPKKEQATIFTSFSMAKSYVSAMIGIAINEGKIKSVNEPIANYIKGFENPGFEKITIEHLLNMRTGIEYVENYFSPFGNVAASYYGRNLDRHVAKLKVEKDPGESFGYISAATQMLGMILEEATGQTLSEYCEQKLWIPLGMEYPASWSVDRKKGREKAFCCLNARARDYAKFGRLFLKEGNWQGTQLISEQWIDKSIKKTKDSKDAFYAYQWWHDSRPDKNGRVNFFAQGHLGQYTYMHPVNNTIIVRLGKNHGGVNWIQLIRELNRSL